MHIPLPLLNQVEMTGFDWQIPGLREELVIALIKSLPKSYRRNFVPAPNYAQAFLSRAVPLEKPLLDTLIYELRRMTGVTVEAEHWNWEQIPSHLKMTFRVVDENGKKIAESMNLDELKFNLKDRVQESISAVADDGIEQSGLHIWNFADLPQCYEQKQRGFSVKAFPAIVDEKMRWVSNCLKQSLSKRWRCNKACADCCYLMCHHQLSICMKNCRIKPNWGCILPRSVACWI